MKNLFTIFVAVLLTASVFAQSPEKMSYQAVIRNSSDVLVVNTQVRMQISILQGSEAGTAVYTETQTPTTNANGLISIEIGTGNTSDDFSTIDWANGPYFIKTETDPAGGTSYTITGTSQLLSVPFALHAKTAETVTGGITETDPVFTAWDKDYNDLSNKPALFDGAFSSLTGTPTTIAGYGITDAFDGGYSSLTGAPTNVSSFTNDAGYLTNYTETDPVFAASPANNITGNNISNWNTAFGWGDHIDNSITNEIQTLSISGSELTLSRDGGTVVIPGDNWGTQTATTSTTLTGNGTAGSPLGLARQSATTGQVLKWDGSNWSPGSDLSGSSIWSKSGSDIYYNAGHAGIGTSAPATYMHLHGVPLASRGQLSLSAPAGEGTFISFYENDEFKAYLWYDASDEDLRLQNFTSGDLNLNPYGGRVGVGTNTPSTTLHVNGQIRITGGSPAAGRVLTSDANGLATWEADPGETTYEIGDFAQGGIVFWLDATGQHGLIAATEDQSAGIQWYNGTSRYTGTTGDGLYAGSMNTAMIVATQMADNQTGNFAAKVCADYSVTVSGVTYGDWYLPSKYELNLLYLQKTVVGGFARTIYWSSTEYDSSTAWYHAFYDGGQNYGSKYYTGFVRAVRAF